MRVCLRHLLLRLEIGEQLPQNIFVSCRVGDVDPGLSSIVPEHTHCLAPVVCQHERDGAVESHPVVELVLKYVQVVESVRIAIVGGFQLVRRSYVI